MAGSDTVSTHALMRARVLQLPRCGVLPELVAAGTPPIRRTVFRYADGETVQVSLRSSLGADALYGPRRQLLDRVLVEAASAARADVLQHTTVVGLLREADGRIVGVRVPGDRGQHLPVRAALAVGADGIASLVAREVAAPSRSEGRASSAILYRYIP